ncbi:MAG TPA: pyridoxal-phosphate dependent enzyme [Candidatus Eisenbacteria bacterium]|nr:pyridoxal-phosphate dependent enzyme [Candidatus Eisenbacteria bacterium]
MPDLGAPTLEEIRNARVRIRDFVLRTPLIRLPLDRPGTTIFLKPENLQEVGSFKVRGAGSAITAMSKEELADGVYTASAGNMAQGLAWSARRLGIPCGVVIPEHAPEAKVAAVERLGANVVKVPFETWWRVMVEHRHPGMRGRFVHPVSDPAVMAGNGTIGLEIAEDLPGVETVLVPYGGGGLSCGIAAALRGAAPRARVVACEVETAAPLTAALAAGGPAAVDYRPSFVDGIGGKSVLAEMWPLATTLLSGAVVVSLEEIAEAIRLLVSRARLVAEGAGAASVAAAASGRAGAGVIVCVVSGGNLDPAILATILEGTIP